MYSVVQIIMNALCTVARNDWNRIFSWVLSFSPPSPAVSLFYILVQILTRMQFIDNIQRNPKKVAYIHFYWIHLRLFLNQTANFRRYFRAHFFPQTDENRRSFNSNALKSNSVFHFLKKFWNFQQMASNSAVWPDFRFKRPTLERFLS